MTPDASRGLPKEAFVPEIVKQLNEAFSKGESAYRPDLLQLMRQLPNPICIDYNRTLVTGRRPDHVATPEAAEAVRILREVGTVIVVSGVAWDDDEAWEVRREALERLGLSDKNTVIMTTRNFGFVEGRDNKYQSREIRSSGEKAIAEYRALMDRSGVDHEGVEWSIGDVHSKHIGPIFQRINVPIIDDSWNVTEDNPGMVGLRVEVPDPEWPRTIDTNCSLLEAARRIKAFYTPGGLDLSYLKKP